ncbi:MAG: transcriptional regulator NrdR [Legionellales bacterium]|nr:transcriptional regulator NrdR [Legionellales bacterium]
MNCPFCSKDDTKVVDSRLMGDGRQVRRRRECQRCKERFTTYESAELILPVIIKRDGRREPFNEQNLRTGILRALEKRPVSIENVERAIGSISHRLQSSGVREISSQIIGEWAMQELRVLDDVAYIRFASVYRCFQDISDFNSEINKLNAEYEKKT